MNEERSLKNTSQIKEEGVPVVNYGTLNVKEIRGEGGAPCMYPDSMIGGHNLTAQSSWPLSHK